MRRTITAALVAVLLSTTGQSTVAHASEVHVNTVVDGSEVDYEVVARNKANLAAEIKRVKYGYTTGTSSPSFTLTWFPRKVPSIIASEKNYQVYRAKIETSSAKYVLTYTTKASNPGRPSLVRPAVGPVDCVMGIGAKSDGKNPYVTVLFDDRCFGTPAWIKMTGGSAQNIKKGFGVTARDFFRGSSLRLTR